MKASELIAQLNEAIEIHGDIETTTDDSDIGITPVETVEMLKVSKFNETEMFDADDIILVIS